jgi:hypothetical protein
VGAVYSGGPMLHFLTLENSNDDARDACPMMENVMDST